MIIDENIFLIIWLFNQSAPEKCEIN